MPFVYESRKEKRAAQRDAHGILELAEGLKQDWGCKTKSQSMLETAKENLLKIWRACGP